MVSDKPHYYTPFYRFVTITQFSADYFVMQKIQFSVEIKRLIC